MMSVYKHHRMVFTSSISKTFSGSVRKPHDRIRMNRLKYYSLFILIVSVPSFAED